MADEPLPKKLVCSKSIKEQMIELQKKIMKNVSNLKFIQQKHTTEMNASFYRSVSVNLI